MVERVACYVFTCGVSDGELNTEHTTRNTQHLIMSANIVSHHAHPIRPVVAPAIPFTKGVGNAFFPQGAAKRPIVFNVGIVLTDNDDDVHAAQRLEPFVIGQIWDEVARRIEVNVVVVVTAEEIAHIVLAAQRQHTTKQVRMAEGDVDGMVCTKTASMCNQEGILVL